MKISTVLPMVCQAVKIILPRQSFWWDLRSLVTGSNEYNDLRYRATGDWSAGHPVFSNGKTYLCVRPRQSVWGVRDSPDMDGARMISGCITWCPASTRAAESNRFYKQESWLFFENNQWKDRQDIRIVCDPLCHTHN